MPTCLLLWQQATRNQVGYTQNRMAQKISRRLDKVERMEAELLADEMLCQRVTERSIVAALREEYAGISAGVARGILKRAIKVMQAQVEKQRPHRRAQQIASLDRLYERAVTGKKYAAALGVQKLLAKIEGTEKPQKHHHTGIAVPVVATDAEFDDRSIEELDFYAEHGHWPDEGAEQDEDEPVAPETARDFPLH